MIENHMVRGEQHREVKCKECNGSGMVDDDIDNFNNNICPACNGVGTWVEDR